jgi:hypothetical protein
MVQTDKKILPSVVFLLPATVVLFAEKFSNSFQKLNLVKDRTKNGTLRRSWS